MGNGLQDPIGIPADCYTDSTGSTAWPSEGHNAAGADPVAVARKEPLHTVLRWKEHRNKLCLVSLCAQGHRISDVEGYIHTAFVYMCVL